MKLIAVKHKKGTLGKQNMVLKKGTDGELHKVNEKMFKQLVDEGKTEEQAVQEILDAISQAQGPGDTPYG